MHVEAPARAGEDVRPRGQSGWQAINRGMLDTINYLADTPLGVDPVQAAIFPADVLCADLIFGLQSSEMPIDIVGGTDIGCHGLILLPNKNPFTTESTRITEITKEKIDNSLCTPWTHW